MLMIATDGRTLSYDVSGAGAPIVFVAGLGDRGTNWMAQVAAFSSAFQVVTFDHRGVGASEGQPPYKVEQWPRTRCGSSITWLRQIFTKPYTPKTNGKAERFIQTVLRESEAAIAAVHRTTRNGASPRPAPSLSFHSEWHKRRVVWIVDA
jgi:pimeloyl-ACP methyl ester carboxylesterase